MVLLILGASGQLGQELVRLTEGTGAAGLDRAGCDVTDSDAVAKAIRDLQPTHVINCAAWTAVDAAEAHEDEARRVNVDGARHVATACAGHGVRLCHLSTDYVFDGSATAPIDEDATPNPQSAYGRSKLDGERAVQTACPDSLMVRSAWLFGTHGPNFVLTILRRIDAGEPLHVVDDQRGTPTWTGHLAPALLRLLDLAPPGTYHLTNSGETSWHGFASAIAETVGAPSPQAIPTSAYPTPARRPAYSALDNRRWRELGQPPLPHWRDGLTAYLRELHR